MTGAALGALLTLHATLVPSINKVDDNLIYNIIAFVIDVLSFPVGLIIIGFGGGVAMRWRNYIGLLIGMFFVVSGSLCIGHAIWDLSH